MLDDDRPYQFKEIGLGLARAETATAYTLRERVRIPRGQLLWQGEKEMVAPFVVGDTYSREQVAERVGMPAERRRGSWDTGYDKWQDEFFVFANVGVAGRTGHSYGNRWDDKDLIWFGKSRAQRGQPQIDQMISNLSPVHIFWRGTDRAPFTYAGIGTAIESSDDVPVEVRWSFEALAPVDLPAHDSVQSHLPVWRRGPPPAKGQVISEKVDGPTVVYVLRLEGDARYLRDIPSDHEIIKIGISNEIDRRLRELNVGFPPGSILRWTCATSRQLPDARQAFQFEGERLERLRSRGQWIGGEFAVVPSDLVSILLD